MRSGWRRVLWALAVALLLAAVILRVLFTFVLPPSESGRDNARYTIGVWEGQVAVFEGRHTFPRQVYDVPVDTLPEQQRREVLEGVPAADDAELSVLLEDYT